ncbi:hypothetical protein H261_00335 [Paramagnetospirillum caucaseum]|uniref:DUF2934 domain-containing protein n=1 Tax=Paramagnetospirillum caucaseum TaxID=1244869 RepID=M2ZC22_9PROT|nr:DUF2934 domain-containing protein [Paramagnetospirillum caucaseum]EME71980.1 hypothetical protein H261_00335 [Paramagnetospirillum caucaseum]
MASLNSERLTLAETGALALDEAARELDKANDTTSFLKALERNQRVWRTLAHIAMARAWQFPSERQVAYALSTDGHGNGANDERVNTLIDINREVSDILAHGDDIARIRERAHAIWESRGRPQGQDMEHWLLAEMELSSG